MAPQAVRTDDAQGLAPPLMTSAMGVWRPLLSRMPLERGGLCVVIVGDGVLRLEIGLCVWRLQR
jgi:hypothetical protein